MAADVCFNNEFYDLILDGTDNLPTRAKINSFSKDKNIHAKVYILREKDIKRHNGSTEYRGSIITGSSNLSENGLSKNYRACGYRAGWMIISGDKTYAQEYIEGLNMLASMRLCSNVPGQLAIQTALGGYQSIDDLVAAGGRLCKQRDLAYEMLVAIPGVTCFKPKAAMYLFPKLDPAIYPIEDDQQFVLDLLEEEKVLLVQGSGFNWKTDDHFRVVFLPNVDDLKVAINRIARFLKNYRMKFGAKV